MKVQMVAIEKVAPYFRNPRKRTEGSLKKIADSISEFGWQQPIVVDKNMVVIIGHGRLEAAKLLECKQVPVVIATNLSDEKARALRLADNRTNRESDWDITALLTEIEELAALNVPLALTAFDDDDLRRLADDVDEHSLERIAESTPESDGDDHPFEADAPGEGSGAGSGSGDAAGPDGLVTFAEVMSLRQRNIVNAAIKLAKDRQRLERRGDALFLICERYLEENE